MTHTLENDQLRLELSPRLGASIVNLFASVGGEWSPLLRHTTPEALERAVAARSASPLGSFTLAPYSNRIPGARFTFEEREYALKPTTPEGNAQHGDVRNRAHDTVSVTIDRAEYLFDSRGVDDFNFPFPLTLRTVYELSGGTVTQTLELTNVGAARMPAGFGIHPYFERHFAGARDAALAFEAGGFYPVGEALIPQGPMQPVPESLDFARERTVDGQAFNTLYGAYGGRAVLRYLGTPYQLELLSGAVFSHLVLFTPPDGSLAVEPVSHATDAFNLHARGVEGVGFAVLEPGEVLRGRIRFRFLNEGVAGG